MLDLQSCLSSMCYRRVRPNLWLKPVGYHLLVVDVDFLEWSNYFKDIQGLVSAWERKKLNENQDRYGTFLQQLKDFECYSRMNVSITSEFHLSPEEFF